MTINNDCTVKWFAYIFHSFETGIAAQIPASNDEKYYSL